MTGEAVQVAYDGADATVDCLPGESILLAGLRAGLPLPYECASGGCGSCRARLTEGKVDSRWPEAAGLSERDRRKGDRILMCQSLPSEPCRVRVTLSEGVDRSQEPRPRRYAARLTERKLLNPNTALFVVDVEDDVEYLPGQFMLLEFPDGQRRAYSMSEDCRGPQRQLEFFIRIKPGGLGSQWLFEKLEPGAELVAEGPYGRAYAQSAPEQPVVCLAGGTGLAPILAIAQRLASESPQRDLHVYVGSARMADAVLAERLLELATKGAKLVTAIEVDDTHVHPLLGPTRSGFALDCVLEDFPDLSRYDLYVAGPTPMIDAVLIKLVRQGTARADRLFFDRFIA